MFSDKRPAESHDGVALGVEAAEHERQFREILDCVQMAIAMQKRVEELAEEWRKCGVETPLQCRIGINTGYCTVGNFGSEDRMDYLASRLEHEAPPGEVLISFETFALVRDDVRCEERGHVQVKGIVHPI